MGLPTSRDETAVPFSPLRSALTNHIQDCIVDLHTELHAPRDRMISGGAGVPNTPGNWVPSFGQAVPHVVTPGAISYAIPVESGEKITVTINLSTSVSGTGGGVTLARRDHAGGAEVNVGSAIIADDTTSQVLVLCTDHAVVSGSSYYLYAVFGTGASGGYIQNIKVVASRLP